MLVFMMASMIAASSTPAPMVEAPRFTGPTRHCREMGSAASRSQAIIICRTKAQWDRAESCTGATRYCAPRKNALQQTAFPMNEDSRIVCRIMKTTGSRLRSSQVCLPQREWERLWKDSAGNALKVQDTSTRARDMTDQ